MIDEMRKIPLGLVQILQAVLTLPAANIFDDIAGIRSLDSYETFGKSFDDVDDFQATILLIVIRM